jgi:hypothetical protein
MAVTVKICSYFCQIKNNRISTSCTGYVLESVIKCFVQEVLLSSKREFLYPVMYRQRPGNIYVIALMAVCLGITSSVSRHVTTETC